MLKCRLSHWGHTGMMLLLMVRVLVRLRRVRGTQGTGGRWQMRLQRRLRVKWGAHARASCFRRV